MTLHLDNCVKITGSELLQQQNKSDEFGKFVLLTEAPRVKASTWTLNICHPAQVLILRNIFQVVTHLFSIQEWCAAEKKLVAGRSLWHKLPDPTRAELHLYPSSEGSDW